MARRGNWIISTENEARGTLYWEQDHFGFSSTARDHWRADWFWGPIRSEYFKLVKIFGFEALIGRWNIGSNFKSDTIESPVSYVLLFEIPIENFWGMWFCKLLKAFSGSSGWKRIPSSDTTASNCVWKKDLLSKDPTISCILATCCVLLLLQFDESQQSHLIDEILADLVKFLNKWDRIVNIKFGQFEIQSLNTWTYS